MPPTSYTGTQGLPLEAIVLGTRSRAYESFSVLSHRKSSVFEVMRHIKVIRQGSPATSMQIEPLPAGFLLFLMSRTQSVPASGFIPLHNHLIDHRKVSS